MTLVLTNYLFKCGVEALMTPVTYMVVNCLKRIEQEDYYDRDTNFNPFTRFLKNKCGYPGFGWSQCASQTNRKTHVAKGYGYANFQVALHFPIGHAHAALFNLSPLGAGESLVGHRPQGILQHLILVELAQGFASEPGSSAMPMAWRSSSVRW